MAAARPNPQPLQGNKVAQAAAGREEGPALSSADIGPGSAMLRAMLQTKDVVPLARHSLGKAALLFLEPESPLNPCFRTSCPVCLQRLLGLLSECPQRAYFSPLCHYDLAHLCLDNLSSLAWCPCPPSLLASLESLLHSSQRDLFKT